MPSKKKDRGRERRAKQAREATEEWRSRFAWGETNLQCNHGRAVSLPEPDHPVHKFLDVFNPLVHIRSAEGNASTYDVMKKLLAEFPEVWDNDSHRRYAIDLATTMATNLLRGGAPGGAPLDLLTRVSEEGLVEKRCWKQLEVICVGILCLEHYIGGYNIEQFLFCDPKASMKLRHLTYERDILKFLARKNSCSCLTEMHGRARKLFLKLGKCDTCRKETERETLMVCSVCSCVQYCCRSCQVAHWPTHKQRCERIVATQKLMHNPFRDMLPPLPEDDESGDLYDCSCQTLAEMVNTSWVARDAHLTS